jgi:lysophospholipase L1-like esterase
VVLETREASGRDPGAASTARSINVWRIAAIILVPFLGLSVYANVRLVDQMLAERHLVSFVTLDPAGLEVYAPDRARASSSATSAQSSDDASLVVLFGDSRIAMWPAPTMGAGYRVVNRGVGYETTAQLLLRVDADVVQLHPAIVVIEAGINDLRAIADFPTRRSEIVASCRANLARLVERCKSAGTRVVIVSVFDVGEVALWRRPFWSKEVASAVREVNSFLPTLTGEKVFLFNADPVLAGGDGTIRRDYQLDHLHLTPAGYDALNRALVPFVSSLGK